MNLPQETKDLIASLCPKRDAISLARVHSSFKECAERVIYRSLVISADPERCERSNHALKSLIHDWDRRLYVQDLTAALFTCSGINEMAESMKTAYLLFKILDDMYHLTELRIRIDYCKEGEVYYRELIDMLREPNLFTKLKTVFLSCPFDNYRTDIPSIARALPNLQSIALYGTVGRGRRAALQTLETLNNAGVERPPLIFEVREWGNGCHIDQLAFPPWFYADHDPQVVLGRIRSLIDDHEDRVPRDIPIRITHMVLYWKDDESRNMALAYDEVAEQHFPGAERLVLDIHDESVYC